MKDRTFLVLGLGVLMLIAALAGKEIAWLFGILLVLVVWG